jgi:mono/diheme cytochrome c family protein
MFRKILLGFLLLVAVAVAACGIYIASRQHLKFNPPYPDIAASADTAVIARGRYVVRNLVNCSQCHGEPTRMAEAMEGVDIPLSGGRHFGIPPGDFYARNITPDSATGIGSFSDGAVARALRLGVGHDGRALLPFMEMQGLSDEDLAAVISYLRSQAPVHKPIPPHHFSLLGMVVKATVLANPVGPKSTPPHQTPHGATIENGRYIVESLALCGSCHTQRNMQTGAFVGPHLGGSTGFGEADANGMMWSPPNITSDPETGRLGHMSEDEFVTRFRAGRLLPNSPMPWQGFKNLAEHDLRAIYKYLMTVSPVRNDVGPPIVPPKQGK